MKKLLPFFLISVISIGLGLLFFRFLKIQKVICSGCDYNLYAKSQSAKNKTLPVAWTFINNEFKNDKSILAYSLNLTLPYNLKIYVIQRDPVVAFKLTNGNYALVDQAGNVKEEAQNTDLPKITNSSPLTNDQIIFISGLMNALHTFYNINEGKITPDGLEIDNLRGKIVIFPLLGDRDVLLGSLNLILSRLPTVKEASTIRTLDLRFKNPVLR